MPTPAVKGAPLHVLMLPSFYQTRERPYNGTFFRDWAQALRSVGVHVGVAFVEDRSLRHLSVEALRDTHFQVADAVEDGIPTLRVKGWNTLAQWTPGGLIWARLSQRAINAYVARHGVPDLVAAQSATWAGAAARLARRRGLRYVITEINTAFGTGTVRGWQQRVSRRAFAGAEAVIAISRNLQVRLTEFGGARSVVLIPCTVDETFWTLPPQARSRAPFTFYAHAHLTRRKGFDLLIRAFASRFRQRTDVRLMIGGDGEIRAELEALAQAAGVASQVSFLGSLPRERMREAMWSADAFVLPSLAENFGVVLIEALATGLPVISTRCGGPEDIVTDTLGRLCQPGDEAGLGDALFALRQEAPRDPEGIRTATLARFSYATVGRRLRDFYLEVLNLC